MGMGTRNQVQPGQVFFDPQTNQYYTQTPGGYGYTNGGFGMQYNKNYIGNPMQQQQISPINDLLAKAAAAKANAPSLASLFPSMGQGMLNAPVNYSGQFGAGRFLGNNQFGNPAQPMGGFAPSVTNT